MDISEARERGLALIPCGKDKKSLVQWKRFQTCPPTTSQYSRWEALKPAAWAVVTGSVSGVVVLDFDGQAGEHTMRRLSLNPHVRTGSGGWHVYVQHPGARIKTTNENNAAELATHWPGMHVKGDGGYAIALGRNTTGAYEWVGPDEFHPWESLPADLRAALLPAPPDTSPDTPECPPERSGDGRVSPDVLIRMALERAPHGRDDAGIWLACQLRDNGYTEDEAEAELEHFRGQAGDTDAHGRHDRLPIHWPREKVSSAYSREPRAPWRDRAEGNPALPGGSSACLADFALTDLGNAERLLAAYGDQLRYNVDSGRWLAWNTCVWQTDETGQVDRLAAEVVRRFKTEIDTMRVADVCKRFGGPKEEEHKVLQRVYQHAKSSESRQRLEAAMALARTAKAYTPVREADLDTDPWALNCQNGTLDLRTGSLGPHRQEDLLTHCVQAGYDPGAECPTWDRFLAEVFDGDSELCDFVQRAAGYSLTGDTSEQVFFLLHGNGSNGKSTFLDTLAELLREYHRQTGTETLLERNRDGIPNDLARLRGARLVSAIETKPGRKLAEALIKQLTGCDMISARFLHKEWFDFSPQFKLWLACNHLPQVDGQDHALWRRIRVIPFNVQFQDLAEAEGPYKDTKLPAALRAEMPGILAWAVRGCRAWQSGGLGHPPAVRAATGDYRASQDVLGEFLIERCELLPGAESSSSELYQAYQQWAQARGERFPLGSRAFSMRLGERGQFQKVKADVIKWHGLRLLTFEEREEREVREADSPFPPCERLRTGEKPENASQSSRTSRQPAAPGLPDWREDDGVALEG